MSELADLRLTIARLRREHEAHLRSLADAHEDAAAISRDMGLLDEEKVREMGGAVPTDGLAFEEAKMRVAQLDASVGERLRREGRQVDARVAAARAGLAQTGPPLERARAEYEVAAAAYPPPWPDAGDVPLVLLPVRLEVVRRGTLLRIRVYPDDVHVDAHEEALTDAEHEAAERYWRAVWAAGPDPERRQAAWQAMLDRLGLARAAWAVEALRPRDEPPAAPTPPGATAPEPTLGAAQRRDTTWTRAARTALMPDRFVFRAYRESQLVWELAGADIPRSLDVSFPPPDARAGAADDGLPWDEHSRWLSDFDEAERNGMAVRMEVAPDEIQKLRFDLLTAVGIRTGEAPEEGAERWQTALRAHQFTGGLGFLPVGTPTNNTPASRAGWDSRPDPKPPEEVARLRREVYATGSAQAAARAARAFGIDGRPVLAVAPKALDDEPEEIALAELHRAIWKLRGGGPLRGRGVLDGGLGRGSELLNLYGQERDDLLATFDEEHFAHHVRARGTLPTLRVGRQPYGVLPATALDLWRDAAIGDDALEHLRSVVVALRGAAAQAPRIAGDADPAKVIPDLLSRRPLSRAVHPVAAASESVDPMTESGGPTHPGAGLTANPTNRHDVHATVGAVGFRHPLFHVASTLGVRRSTPPTPEPDVADPVGARLLEACARPLRALTERPADGGREAFVPDLDALVRDGQGMTRALAPLMRDPRVGAFYPFALRIHLALWELHAQLARRRLSGSETPAARDRVADVQAAADALEHLERRAGEDGDIGGLSELNTLLCESLDCISHRIDPWVTSLAAARLAALRARRPTGLHIGAYGWLTLDRDLDDPRQSGEGYVISPSMQHAATAALLRSGFSAFRDPKAFAVDLQSARVRQALALVDGVRSGQPVAALLGYQLERSLHDAGLDGLIRDLRRDYPLAALVEDSGAPAEERAKVAQGARHVVDGLTLRNDFVAGRFDPGVFAPGQAEQVRGLLVELDEAIDAVGDLLLAESVHQLVGGNVAGAGRAADAIGREGVPDDFAVVRTPRSADAVAYHVGLLGGPDAAGPPGWSDDRELAKLEPALEAWCRARLGPAAAWRFEAAGGAEANLGDRGWCALDLLQAAAGGGRPLRDELRPLAGGAPLAPAGEDRLEELVLLCSQLRAVLAAGTPLLPVHLDADDRAGWRKVELGGLRTRIEPWLSAVRGGRDRLAAAVDRGDRAAVAETLDALADLGVAGAPAPSEAGVVEHGRLVLARLEPAPASPRRPPPDPAAEPDDGRFALAASEWFAEATAAVAAVLGEAIKVVPVLRRSLPGAPAGADGEAVARWLAEVAPVRPRVELLDEGIVGGRVVAGAGAGRYAVAQVPEPPAGASVRWVATGSAGADPPARSTLVLHHDGPTPSRALAGLLVDSWSEAIPRAPDPRDDPRPLGPEEIVGLAYDYDAPGARAPQAIVVAVPPNVERGWRREDVHAVVEETLALARVRALTLSDLPDRLAGVVASLMPTLPLPPEA